MYWFKSPNPTQNCVFRGAGLGYFWVNYVPNLNLDCKTKDSILFSSFVETVSRDPRNVSRQVQISILKTTPPKNLFLHGLVGGATSLCQIFGSGLVTPNAFPCVSLLEITFQPIGWMNTIHFGSTLEEYHYLEEKEIFAKWKTQVSKGSISGFGFALFGGGPTGGGRVGGGPTGGFVASLSASRQCWDWQSK